MNVLVVDDDPVSRRVLEAMLSRWGYDVEVARDGLEAWQRLEAPAAPPVIVLDWMMPDLDGPELCRRIRASARPTQPYVLLLTTKTAREDIVVGLSAGADDYLTKPFDRDELKARLQVGVRVIELQRSLADRVAALEHALERVKMLQGLLPICSYCKKIRDDRNYWKQVDTYIAEHSEAQFTHSVCPECYTTLIEPQLTDLEKPLVP